MSVPAARTWSSLLDLEEIDLGAVYDNALCTLAMYQAVEDQGDREDQGEEANEEDTPDTPDISEPEVILASLLKGDPPTWWPKRLDRMEMRVRLEEHGKTSIAMEAPIDPGLPEFGKKAFRAHVKRMCVSMVGDCFDGHIHITFLRKSDHVQVGGWHGEVYIGVKAKKGKIGEGRGQESDLLELFMKKVDEKDEAIQRMFANSSNVIHASAAAINAARGMNVGPPWMQEGGEEMPFWMKLAQGALEMAVGAGLGNGAQEAAGRTFERVMSQPTHRQLGALSAYQDGRISNPNPYAPRALPGPSPAEGPEEEGEYDGYYTDDRDIVHDDFEEQTEPWDEYGANTWDDSGEWIDPDQDLHEGDQEEEASGDFTFDGHTPDEIARELERYIDNNPNHKAAFRKIGTRLATKLLG